MFPIRTILHSTDVSERTGASLPAPEPGTAPQQGPTPAQVFRDYAPRVYNLARRLLGNAADAEDVTQDVFVQVLSKLPSFRGDAAFSTWLYRVTVNAALAYRRRQAVRKTQPLPEPLAEFSHDGGRPAPVRRWVTAPEEQAIDHETHHLIEEAIASLPEDYRDVYILADVEGLPSAEIAELLGLSVAAVKSRLHRARLAMRKRLAPHFEETAA